MATLRDVEGLRQQGQCLVEAVRQVGTTEPTYRRWRRQYAGLSQDEIR